MYKEQKGTIYYKKSIYQEALEENENRVSLNPEYYRLRQQITEHQFGTLKRQWGFSYTLMKEIENVLSERQYYDDVQQSNKTYVNYERE